MKQIFAISVCVLMVLSSCNSKTSTGYVRPRIDTIKKALFQIQYPEGGWSGPIMDSVILQITCKYVFTDSAKSIGGHWVSDTIGYGRIPNDSLRDAAKKPVFDSLHRPLFHYIFYHIPPGSLQRLNIPYH